MLPVEAKLNRYEDSGATVKSTGEHSIDAVVTKVGGWLPLHLFAGPSFYGFR